MPVSIDDWNRMVNRSASSLAHVLRSFPGIPSGPVALCSSVSLRSLSTPTFEILMGGRVEGVAFGGGLKFVCLSGSEKTLENCALKALALSFGLWMVLLLMTRSLIPKFSLRWLLTYVQKFLLLLSVWMMLLM